MPNMNGLVEFLALLSSCSSALSNSILDGVTIAFSYFSEVNEHPDMLGLIFLDSINSFIIGSSAFHLSLADTSNNLLAGESSSN